MLTQLGYKPTEDWDALREQLGVGQEDDAVGAEPEASIAEQVGASAVEVLADLLLHLLVCLVPMLLSSNEFVMQVITCLHVLQAEWLVDRVAADGWPGYLAKVLQEPVRLS